MAQYGDYPAAASIDDDDLLLVLKDGVTNKLTAPVLATRMGTDLGLTALTNRVTATEAVANAAATGTQLSALDTRVAYLEQGGIIQNNYSTVTIASNANTFVAAQPDLVLAANTLAVGDRLMHFAFGRILNDSGGSVVYDWRWALGATPAVLAATPTAGYSSAAAGTAGLARHWQSVFQLTYLNATSKTFRCMALFQLSAFELTVGEMAAFNGASAGQLSGVSTSHAEFDATVPLTFKFQTKTRTSSAAAQILTAESVWSVLKAS